ncbi:MAG: aldehyde ferredoxin oxidoreductase family protein [Pseudomonadota bacterium]
MKGIHGKILVVNLTERSYEIEELPEEIYRRYLGGYGLGAYYIYKHIKPGCDPLGPDNILGFTPGLFTGSGAGFSGRYMVCGKSPLTGKGIRSNGEQCNGGWGNANSGGTFGPSIKKAGFDAIFFKGQSEKPVYLLIANDKISIEDAGFLWGKDTVETEEELAHLHGARAKVASIGPAGENLSLISGICNDKGRIAARSGLGAVMGSKKLKAVCLLAGKAKVEYADKVKIREITKEYYTRVQGFKQNKLMIKLGPLFDYFAPVMRLLKMPLAASPESLGPVLGGTYGGAKLGTPMSAVISAQTGDSPVKNYKGAAVPDFPMKKAMKLRGKRYLDYGKKQYGCHSCPLHCGYILKYDKLPYKDKETHRPEYETVASFGSLILNEDIDLVLQANEYLNRVCLDTISAGVVVAYVLEGVEEGFFKKEAFACKEYPEGFLPIWGDPTYVMQLLKLMTTREGIGDKLADGVWVAKKHFPGTEYFAIDANGSEMGMHDLRVGHGWAMSYISDPTPGRHTTANYDHTKAGTTLFFPEMAHLIGQSSEHPYQQGRISIYPIKLHQVMESIGVCMFVYFFGDYKMIDMIEAATGWKMTPEEIMQIGGRIQTLRQMFNAREGAIRHELPQRAIGSPPLKTGAARGQSLDVEITIQGYYEAMGYRNDGVPREETLRAYGLDDIIPDLAKCTGAPERLVNEWLYSGAALIKKKKNKKDKAVIGG